MELHAPRELPEGRVPRRHLREGRYVEERHHVLVAAATLPRQCEVRDHAGREEETDQRAPVQGSLRSMDLSRSLTLKGE